MYIKTIGWSIKNLKINIVIKILILSDFILFSAYNLIAPVFAVFVMEQVPGATISTVGISAAIYLLIKSVCEIPVGLIIDRSKTEKDDYWTVILGSLVAAIVFFLYIYVNSVAQLYALQALLGLSSAFAYPGWYAIFTRHIDKDKVGLEWSMYDVIIGIGMAATAALGGLIVAEYNFPILFVIGGVTSLLGVFTLFFIYNRIK